MNTNPMKEARTAVAVAEGLREAATQCGPQQPALRARLIVAATHMDVLRELLLEEIGKRNPVTGMVAARHPVSPEEIRT